MVSAAHMARALELAGEHHPHPNPRVGAVVVDRDGQVAGEGAHIGPGRPHAEVVAIEAAGERAVGSTVYLTLEPCTHHGRTPPCVEAIIAAGVARVVVAVADPDPRVSGRGVRRLGEAGVDVVTGLMEQEALALDPGYFHHRVTGRPLVTMKYAMTLDGAVAAADGTSRWITSPTARIDAHRLRAESDGVVVGAGTLRSDDPLLDVRIDGYTGRQPVPVVLAGAGDLPKGARLWERRPLVVATGDREIPSGELVLVGGVAGLPDPTETCRALADRGLISLLLEGGPRVAGAWWRAGAIDRGVIYLGSRLGGGVGRTPLEAVFASVGEAEVVTITGVDSLEGDLRVEFTRS